MAEQITKAKKKWTQIIAPKLFGNQVLGESLVAEPAALVGRAITANLATLTGEIKQQSVNIKFKIIGLKDGSAVTEIEGFAISPALIKRLVRRETKRLDEVIRCETADKKLIVLKFFLVTKTLVRSATKKALRKTLEKTATELIKKATFEDAFRMFITNKFQMQIKNTLKKIYPLKACEIKKMSIIKTTELLRELPQKIKEPEPKKEVKAETKEVKEKELEVKQESEEVNKQESEEVNKQESEEVNKQESEEVKQKRGSKADVPEK